MPKNLDKIYEETLNLPDESKAILAERIIDYLETHINPDIERIHLDTVKRRKDDIKKGKVKPVSGDDAAVMVRKIISK